MYSNQTLAHAPLMAESRSAVIQQLFQWEHAELSTNLKRSYVTRRVPVEVIAGIEIRRNRAPQAGDLIVAKINRIHQHKLIHTWDGRRSQLYGGDHVLVAYGNRYAPDQYESVVPPDLAPCELVACGGVASMMLSKHSSKSRPTEIEPLGYAIGEDTRVINLKDHQVPLKSGARRRRVPTIGVVGTSMNAGKTTTVASLIKGLDRAGFRVAAVKATGTGAGNDMWSYADAGAALTLDFTDAGYVSTYKLGAKPIQDCFQHLLLAAQGEAEIGCIIVEVADGLFHGETADLITSRVFRETCDHLMFAAGDAMGAAAGHRWLKEKGIEVTAISGLASASPLVKAETERNCGLRVLSKQSLEARSVCNELNL